MSRRKQTFIGALLLLVAGGLVAAVIEAGASRQEANDIARNGYHYEEPK